MTEEKPETKYASFNMRMFASVIDSVLSLVVMVPVINILSAFLNFKNGRVVMVGETITPEQAIQILNDSLPSFFLQNVIFAVVVIIFWIYRSGTPGKMMLGMKIVDEKTEHEPTKKQFIIRYLGYFISFLPFCLGFVWIYFDKKKQGWHDKISNTVVLVNKEKGLFSYFGKVSK